jgi:L-gulonate 5-dehydrogenase
MKTVIITKPYEYKVIESPIPEIKGEHDVLVKMKAAGVCGSDIHIYKGENPCTSYPRVPGHENVGIAEAVGAAVTNVKAGDHVVIDLLITCGKCFQCTHGRENVCRDITVRGSSADGGFTEYLIVPDDDLYPISKALPFTDAVLIEPFCIGAHSTARGRIASDDTVFILGSGTIGSVITQFCKIAGATVIACDVLDDSLSRIRGYGADYTINSETEDVVGRVREITGGEGVSAAFDSACFRGSLAFLLRDGILGNAGRLVSLGFTSEPEQISQADIDQRELEIIGSRMSAYQFRKVADMLAAGRFKSDGIVSDYIKFDEIEKLFDKIEHPDPATKKMVVLFS